MVSINSRERDELRQAKFCSRYINEDKPNGALIPDRSHIGLIMTAPTAEHRSVGDKYAIHLKAAPFNVTII